MLNNSVLKESCDVEVVLKAVSALVGMDKKSWAFFLVNNLAIEVEKFVLHTNNNPRNKIRAHELNEDLRIGELVLLLTNKYNTFSKVQVSSQKAKDRMIQYLKHIIKNHRKTEKLCNYMV